VILQHRAFLASGSEILNVRFSKKAGIPIAAQSEQLTNIVRKQDMMAE